MAGIDYHGKRILFVADGLPNPLTRGDANSGQRAKAESAHAIRELPEDPLFSIAVFTDHVYVWRNSLTPATLENKRNAIAYLDNAFVLRTNIKHALDATFDLDSRLKSAYLFANGILWLAGYSDARSILNENERCNL